METTSIRAGEITQSWYVIDAENQILGRLASTAAQILRGKNKPYFTPIPDSLMSALSCRRNSRCSALEVNIL